MGARGEQHSGRNKINYFYHNDKKSRFLQAQWSGFFIGDQLDEILSARLACVQSIKIAQLYDIGVKFAH
jgi:hypothetical protein